ncbi:MAG: hypothetical protein AAB638_00990 [Patescibacteria group bacterium]
MNKVTKPFIAGLLVLFVGTFAVTYFGLYESVPYMDKAMHLMGGFVVAWFFGKLWENQFKSFGNFQRLLLLLGMAMTIGYAWEIMEYAGSNLSIFEGHPILNKYIYTGGFTDSLVDLFADGLGACIYALLIFS